MSSETARRAERVANDLRQLLRGLMNRLRAESADNELTPSEQAVLRRLFEHGPATTAALARAEWVKPQSMGATVAGLEAADFVTRAVDAGDARCRTVSITEKGESLIQAGRASRQGWLARRIDEALDAEEQRALQVAIDLLRRVVEP